MAPAHPRPDGRLPAGRRLRGEAGHRHRRPRCERRSAPTASRPRCSPTSRRATPAAPRRRPPGSGARRPRSSRPSAIRPPPAPAPAAPSAPSSSIARRSRPAILTARPSTSRTRRAKDTNELFRQLQAAPTPQKSTNELTDPFAGLDWSRSRHAANGPPTPLFVHGRAQAEQRPAEEQQVDADDQAQRPGGRARPLGEHRRPRTIEDAALNSAQPQPGTGRSWKAAIALITPVATK